MVHRLFVLVATGQNVANLPPVLEIADRGDKVVWVESPAAQEGKWADGASKVLHRFGLDILPPVAVEEVNNPADLVRALEPVSSAWQGKLRPVIVANGGNKLTPMGLLRAFESASPLVLYGNNCPVELWSFEHGILNPPQIIPYQRHTLDLLDVLAASAHQIQNPGAAKRIWPTEQLPPCLQESDRYGVDPAYTQKLHRDHARWALPRARTHRGIIPYKTVGHLVSKKRIKGWRLSFFSLLWSARHQNSPADPELGDTKTPTDRLTDFLTDEAVQTVWSHVYHATANLIEDAALAQARLGMTPPETDLGKPFEKAVARRLWQWLHAGHGNEVVQSVWRNVSVCHQSAPETVIAEFDILIVLRNGILLHIECKSFKVAPKDLDARLLNLQRAGSLLSQMAICAPLYTQFAEEDWFRTLHDSRQRIESVGRFQFLPFTLPNQPGSYCIEEVSAPKAKQREYTCPSFEEALEKFLAPFRLHSTPSRDTTKPG